jgi:anti-anti-sigma factor
MKISIDTSTIPCRVILAGEMTVYAAANIMNKLIAAIDSAENVEIDLSQISEIDTTGAQLLILAKRHAERTDKQLQLVSYSPSVRELIDVYRLGAFFGESHNDINPD